MPRSPGIDLPAVVHHPDPHSADKRLPLDLTRDSDSTPTARARDWVLKDNRYSRLVRILALVCIGVGVALRVVHFGSMPPGLNQDEASIGYDAWCLAHFGTEGNGVSWPVHLISWGNGGNASYAYMALPFVATFGLAPFTVRLPMLIASLASLLLVWFVIERLFDERAAWASAAVVALSPWHIMLSRWALDCNALPFLFLCGLSLLTASLEANRKFVWLLLACVIFGVSVYSYGAAYLAVPLFVLSALVLCTGGGIFTKRQALTAALLFALTALPMALYIVVNLFHWDSIHLVGVTVPREPTTPRFQTETTVGPLHHVGEFLRLLVTQRDGTPYNVTDPYGVVYSGIFFALAIGLIAVIPVFVARRQWPQKRLFIPLWILACIPTGIVQEPNINRLNLLLMGLVCTVGVALAILDRWVRGTVIVGLVSLLTLSGFFARDYFTTQRDRIADVFFDGLLPALAYARSNTAEDGKICVTSEVNMPQIYVLFNSPSDADEYMHTVKYINPEGPFRAVSAYGRYTFGLGRCDFEHAQVVVAHRSEYAPAPLVKSQTFALFDVYTRR